MRNAKRILAVLLLGSCLLVFGLPGRLVRAGGSARGEAEALERTLRRAIEKTAPSLVRIRPRKAEDKETLARRTRTGVAIAADLVVTDAFGMATFGVDDLVVETLDGKVREARLRGRDLRLRLVVLEVKEGGLAPIKPAPRAPETGRFALALGTVLGGPLPSATFGIVSAPQRFEGRVFETDAAIDPSNAGGPVVDLEGGLLGVAVIVDRRLGDGSGVGFAVPWTRIGPVLARLRAGDELEPGVLGVTLENTLVPGDALAGGVRIDAVRPLSPAARAGLRDGDVIVGLDPAGSSAPGGRIRSLRGLRVRLSCLAAGDAARVTVRRGLAEQAFSVTLERPAGSR